MTPYSTSNRNTLPVTAKVILSVLGVFVVFITILPREFLTAPCTWLHHSLSSATQRGVGSVREWGSHMGRQGKGGDEKRQKVQLEVHIMSKCPDARGCMEDLVFPALEKLGSEIVDFKISFIGKTTPGNGGVACMHGPGECLGNMVHLCGAKLYPYSHAGEKETTTFIPFSQCLIHDYQKLPDQAFIEDCAKEGGVDFQKINECLSDQGFEGGIELLKSSVEWSEYLGVWTSCTIRLAGQRRCVMDGGEWKDCEGGSRVEDLVRDVKAEYYGDKEVDGMKKTEKI